VYALTAHTHRLGHAVAQLLDAGLTVEAVPTVRAAFEAAITASWICQVPDAMPAFLNANHRQQKAMRDTVMRAGWLSGDGHIHADTLTPFLVSPKSKTGANQVQTLCQDFVAGDAMYSTYRGLSWMTHPTAATTDLYLRMRPGSPHPTLATSPTYSIDEMMPWLHVMCSSLVWSARALNLIDHKRAQSADRRRIRAAAKRLGIHEFLVVTPAAVDRGRKAERQRVAAELRRQPE